MSRIFALVSLLALCTAFRIKMSATKSSSDATVKTESKGECDGAYSIPNYLFTDNDKGQAWKYGIPPGAKVTLKQDFTSSMNQWLKGMKGIVVADSTGQKGLVPDYLDDGRAEVCYFSGYVYFPDAPNGNLGQKNRFMYKDSLGHDVYGINFMKFTVKDVSIEPESLEEHIESGYKLLGPQLDPVFAEEIISDVLITSDRKILEVKPEILMEAAELIPDSEILQPIQTIIEAKLEAAAEIPDSRVLETIQPLLHVVDVGKLAVPDEMILDAVVRVVALPPESPKDPPKSGKKVGQACKASNMEDVKECCKIVTKKFWIIDCCWHACHKLFTDEQGVCMEECKDGRVD